MVGLELMKITQTMKILLVTFRGGISGSLTNSTLLQELVGMSIHLATQREMQLYSTTLALMHYSSVGLIQTK